MPFEEVLDQHNCMGMLHEDNGAPSVRVEYPILRKCQI